MKSVDIPGKPNIGFLITSSGWGGLEMNVLQLALWMRERGWNIIFFCNNDTKIGKHVAEKGFTANAFNSAKKYFDRKAAQQLSRQLTHQQIELLWVFDNKDLDVAAITKRKYTPGIKLIYQQHMQIGIKKKDFFHTRRYKAIDLWISPLHWLKEEVSEKTRFPSERTVVIPLGVDTDHFTSFELEKSKAKALFGLVDNIFTIGCIGRIDPGKGQLFLCEALKTLLDAGKEVQMLIIGEPTINDPRCMDYYHEIKRYIEHNDLAEKIVVHAFIDDVRPFFKAIDLFALASVGETYGMVTIEALLNGIPVIGTNTGGTPEILGNGHYGLLYSPGNTNEFVTSVVEIMSGKLNLNATDICRYAKDTFDYKQELDQVERHMMNLLKP